MRGVAVAQVFELLCDDPLEGFTDHHTRSVIFRQAADEQVDIIDCAKYLLQVDQHNRITGYLVEAGISCQPKRLARCAREGLTTNGGAVTGETNSARPGRMGPSISAPGKSARSR
jgi:hypothetical protein